MDLHALWKDEPAFIIGGGASLNDFNWNLIQGKRTIGCNHAFRLGVGFCQICVFGDSEFFGAADAQLHKYSDDGGLVVTNSRNIDKNMYPWILFLNRVNRGLGLDSLGWNGNTGSSALNLALILGASPIYLLGYDMKMNRNPNWHEFGLSTVTNETYKRFIDGFHPVFDDYNKKFSRQEVYNVTNDSDLPFFKKITPREVFGKKWKA